ncbi:Histone deacetylase 11 [Chamberlinius hualienensis]
MEQQRDDGDFKLYLDISSCQLPIIYSSQYNVKFYGLEKFHPFDSTKWGRVYGFLNEAEMLNENNVVVPVEATDVDLLSVHSRRYLNSLKWSANVARITEVLPLACLPNYFVQKYVLRPFRFQTGGTVLAAKLALERGWAINIGGGFHHCSAERGGGFCAYADITLSIRFAFDKLQGVARVLIVDLDAHQGNGHERDFMNDERVYIMDVYNRGIYPRDEYAKRAIKRKIELHHFTEDEEYLDKVALHLDLAVEEFVPDLIVYNAGTDVLIGDPLGSLRVSAQGILRRDEMVFKHARMRNIPILMLTSGGYLRQTARIIANSILNLKDKKLIS